MSQNIATNTPADREQLLQFLRAILLTTRGDGSPQGSPVTAGIDGDVRLVIATYPPRAKVANARRNAAGSAIVVSDDWNVAWVQVWGHLEVLDLPDALEPLVEYYRAVAGEHPNWNEYRQAMVTQRKSLLRLTIDRWGPIATGGFPAQLAEGPGST